MRQLFEIAMSIVLTTVIIFTPIYLLGAFYNVSFNIAKWSIESRGLVAIIGLASVIGSMIAVIKDE